MTSTPHSGVTAGSARPDIQAAVRRQLSTPGVMSDSIGSVTVETKLHGFDIVRSHIKGPPLIIMKNHQYNF